MKNQYFGDVSDYKKYGILRCFANESGLRLMVCWMLTRDDESTDGKHTGYLRTPERWRRYDIEVFDILANSVLSENIRDVALVEKENIIPNAQYYSRFLEDSESDRIDFFGRLHTSLSDTDILFLDPDNGLEVKSIAYGKRGSSKYLYWNELTSLFETGCSLLVYQHFNRSKRDLFIRRLALEMIECTSSQKVIALQTSHTVFFLITQPYHLDAIEIGLKAICSRWGAHITVTAHTLTKVESVGYIEQPRLL